MVLVSDKPINIIVLTSLIILLMHFLRIGETNAILPLPPHGQRGAYRFFPSSLQPKIFLVYCTNEQYSCGQLLAPLSTSCCPWRLLWRQRLPPTHPGIPARRCSTP